MSRREREHDPEMKEREIPNLDPFNILVHSLLVHSPGLLDLLLILHTLRGLGKRLLQLFSLLATEELLGLFPFL